MSASEKIWSRTLLPIGSTLKEAAQVLNESSLKIVLVVDSDGVLLGTISDGDIRRGLLKGLELTNLIKSIVNVDPIVVPPELSREVVIQLMTANKILQIPIVNERKQAIGLHVWDQINEPVIRDNTMVIMAGGKGTRLHPQTANCPKPLLPVRGKPILEHIIERAKVEGFSHFVIAIHHLGHMIEEHFGNGDSFGVKIDYLREKSPLGTAGALTLLDPLPQSPFLVTNGDVLTDIHYGEMLDFHIQSNASGTMAVRTHDLQNPFGVVTTEGIDITGYEEKPVTRSVINAGVYVLNPVAVSLITQFEQIDMPTLFKSMQSKGFRTIVYPVHERWLDVGRPSQLAEAEKI
jgi:dTDP-glucose pyrophosphorylase